MEIKGHAAIVTGAASGLGRATAQAFAAAGARVACLDMAADRARPTADDIDGLAIALTVLAFNILGDALREALDPRSKERS